MNKKKFSSLLISWYRQEARDLPWRHTRNPYHIWLSEIILQQTRVDQGLPYYLKFIEQYPTIHDLANADISEVLRLWQGLGYYTRARNLHHTANNIVRNYGGKFPGNYKDLLELKGVGKYTAAAIASFAFGENVAVLDGNVLRVLARIFGIETDIATNKGMVEFNKLANELLPQKDSYLFNQAIMEFGALHCTPAAPKCETCPFSKDCIANLLNKQGALPVRINKVKKRSRYFHYFVVVAGLSRLEFVTDCTATSGAGKKVRPQLNVIDIPLGKPYRDTSDNRQILMRERTQNDIWKGLYDFFLIEEDHLVQLDDLKNNTLIKQLNSKQLHESKIYKHILTHQTIYAKFWIIQPGFQVVSGVSPACPQVFGSTQFDKLTKSFGLNAYDIDKIKQLPKPVLINNFLQDYFF
ncbi:MAG: A/G-specific adenine glycosylase [Cytophagales bacterium]|nr:A/G-specific adenine glycosylase [Cytophagales bacterium]